MNDQELDRLEQDLAAVAGRLERRMEWEQLSPRVRRALNRPMRELVGTLCLFAACVGIGFWTPSVWLVAGGLLLAVLPGRVGEVRRRRRDLQEVGQGDLLALVRRELMVRLAHHFGHALLAFAFALLFAGVALLASDSRPGLLAAAVLALLALVRLFWLFPRASRALRAFERGEVAA